VVTVNERRIILDTGPLVAFLNRQDKHHRWALMQWERLQPPLITCEAVLSEACFLLSGFSGGQAAVITLVSIHGRNYPAGIKKAHFVLVF